MKIQAGEKCPQLSQAQIKIMAVAAFCAYTAPCWVRGNREMDCFAALAMTDGGVFSQ
jgi:hypothetical protein